MGTPLRGDAFLLKVGDGASSEVFTTIAGLRPTSITMDGETVDVTDKDSETIRELLAGGGIKSLSISAGGVYEATADQKLLGTACKAGTLDNYQLADGDDTIEGAFQVSQYQRSGEHNGEVQFSVTLESSGDWTTT